MSFNYNHHDQNKVKHSILFVCCPYVTKHQDISKPKEHVFTLDSVIECMCLGNLKILQPRACTLIFNNLFHKS